jgi:hypothetical protein
MQPLHIYDEHHCILLKRHAKWSSSNLSQMANENVSTDVESGLTTSSSQKFQIWDCSKGNLTIIWIQELYNTFSSFQLLLAHPNTIDDLEVMTLQSWPGCWNAVMDRIEHPENSWLLTPIQMQYQETLNTNIIANFLSFPMVIKTL